MYTVFPESVAVLPENKLPVRVIVPEPDIIAIAPPLALLLP